jgi:hypothetical protein
MIQKMRLLDESGGLSLCWQYAAGTRMAHAISMAGSRPAQWRASWRDTHGLECLFTEFTRFF